MLATHGPFIYVTQPAQGTVTQLNDVNGDGTAEARATVSCFAAMRCSSPTCTASIARRSARTAPSTVPSRSSPICPTAVSTRGARSASVPKICSTFRALGHGSSSDWRGNELPPEELNAGVHGQNYG